MLIANVVIFKLEIACWYIYISSRFFHRCFKFGQEKLEFQSYLFLLLIAMIWEPCLHVFMDLSVKCDEVWWRNNWNFRIPSFVFQWHGDRICSPDSNLFSPSYVSCSSLFSTFDLLLWQQQQTSTTNDLYLCVSDANEVFYQYLSFCLHRAKKPSAPFCLWFYTSIKILW